MTHQLLDIGVGGDSVTLAVNAEMTKGQVHFQMDASAGMTHRP